MAANPIQLSGLARRLVEDDLLGDTAAKEASEEATKARVPFVTHLVANDLVSARDIANSASQEFGTPLIDISAFDIESVPKNLVDDKLIRANHAMPIFHRGNRLFVAVSDPTNRKGLDDIRFHTGITTEEVLVEENKLSAFIDAYLDSQDSGGLGDLGDEDVDLDLEAVDEQGGGEEADEGTAADDTPVVRFINKMLMDAIKKGSSDLHFEPFEKAYRVRFRTDGVLHEVARPPVNLAPRISARLKVMSQMDISERRVPQDGRIKLKISKTNPSVQIGEMMIKLSTIFQKSKINSTIVQGDTNTVLAASFASLKNNLPISHVESGLRSYDWRMPEEHNRISVDHISELLFAPTNFNKKTLLLEKVHGKIHVTGNTVIDALQHFSKFSEKKSLLSFEKDSILLTLHRFENIENKQVFTDIINTIIKSNEKFIFPIHPHTRKNLKKFNLFDKITNCKNIITFPSVGYFDMIELMKKCSFIMTDSGGLQEEATAPQIRKKVLVLRNSSDRPESIVDGLSVLVGTNPINIISSIKKTVNCPKIKSKKYPYGIGKSSDKILKIIKNYF